MKWVKIYEDYNKIEEICDQYGIKNWTLNSNGEIDVDGDVNLFNISDSITKLPLKFGTIGGNFYCQYNKLTSLEGSPRIVRGSFWCDNNQLTSLEGSPKTVTGDFNCMSNQIRSFEGSPMYIDGVFTCINNPIYPIWCLFRDWSKVEFLNDCDAIQDRNIIMDRLNYFLSEVSTRQECSEFTIKILKYEGYKIIY